MRRCARVWLVMLMTAGAPACNLLLGLGDGSVAATDAEVDASFEHRELPDVVPAAEDTMTPVADLVPSHVGAHPTYPDAAGSLSGAATIVVGHGTVTITDPRGAILLLPPDSVTWSEPCRCTVLWLKRWSLASGEEVSVRQETPLAIITRTAAIGGRVEARRVAAPPQAPRDPDGGDADIVSGPPEDGRQAQITQYGVGGGGGGGGATPGGDGGGNAVAAGGKGGAPSADPRMLHFGGRGGRGGLGCESGEGGGALQISALSSLVVTGLITVNGQGAPDCPGATGGGGGGGAGGALWLEAATGDLGGTFASVGGGGAGGSGTEAGVLGPAGQSSVGTTVALGGGWIGGSGGGYLQPTPGAPPTLFNGGRSGGGGGGAAGLIHVRGGLERSGAFVPRYVDLP